MASPMRADPTPVTSQVRVPPIAVVASVPPISTELVWRLLTTEVLLPPAVDIDAKVVPDELKVEDEPVPNESVMFSTDNPDET